LLVDFAGVPCRVAAIQRPDQIKKQHHNSRDRYGNSAGKQFIRHVTIPGMFALACSSDRCPVRNCVTESHCLTERQLWKSEALRLVQEITNTMVCYSGATLQEYPRCGTASVVASVAYRCIECMHGTTCTATGRQREIFVVPTLVGDIHSSHPSAVQEHNSASESPHVLHNSKRQAM
jgi:hypothetical protein